nr:EOG090X0IGL [Lepidurus arcticus]
MDGGTSKKAGKQATKGQKQIVEENQATLKFYMRMSLGSNAAYFLVYTLLCTSYTSDYVLSAFAAFVCFASYRFMAYMARPKYNETGQILDGGVDLNMEAGVAEHVKDLIILTTGSQLLSIITRYFWLLWLLAPARVAQMAWRYLISPWLFQPAPAPSQEETDKKQKKMERRMRRQR